MAVYLRVIVSSESEAPWVLLNCLEMPRWVRAMLLYEPNATNLGKPKEVVFPKILDGFDPSLSERIRYRVLDILSESDPSLTDAAIELNEQSVRHGFTRLFALKPWDIVICVDADEIIHRTSYRRIVLGVLKFGSVQLGLRQFMFRANYIWQDFIFYAPTASFYGLYSHKPYSHWRYKGRKLSGIVGSHFSFVMTIDQMLEKLARYRHAVDNERFADRQQLEAAVKNKRYIFEPDRQVKFVELTRTALSDRRSIYPSSFEIVESLLEGRFSDVW